MRILVAGLCVLFMAGCSSVTMKEPFAETKLTEEEQGQLEGMWRLDEQVVQVAFASNGVPWLASVEWKDEDFVLNKSRLYFAERNGALYVCMPPEPGKTNEFFFAEIKPDGNKALVWIPDVDFFAERVDSGVLKGTVEVDKHSKSISLENSSLEILELVSTNRAAFDYRNPLLFQRLD